MGVVFVVLLILETFACGVLITRCRDLKEENDLLRDSLPIYHTNDWPTVDEEANNG